MIKEEKGKRQIELDRKGASLDVVSALINSEEAEEAVILFRSGGFFLHLFGPFVHHRQFAQERQLTL